MTANDRMHIGTKNKYTSVISVFFYEYINIVIDIDTQVANTHIRNVKKYLLWY